MAMSKSLSGSERGRRAQVMATKSKDLLSEWHAPKAIFSFCHWPQPWGMQPALLVLSGPLGFPLAHLIAPEGSPKNSEGLAKHSLKIIVRHVHKVTCLLVGRACVSDDLPHSRDLSQEPEPTSADCGPHWQWADRSARQLLQHHNIIIQTELERAGCAGAQHLYPGQGLETQELGFPITPVLFQLSYALVYIYMYIYITCVCRCKYI